MARGELATDPDADDDAASPTAASDTDEVDGLLAAIGVQRVGATGPQQVWASARPHHVWPELLPVLSAWRAVQSQWRTADGLPTGLDYAGVEAALRLCRAGTARRRARLFADLQLMERAWLDAVAEQRREAAVNAPKPR